MNVHALDELTYDLEVDGELVRRTLATRVWESRGWATVLMVFEERGTDGWKAAKTIVIRFRRSGDGWKKASAITLPGAHALAIAGELEKHRGKLAGDDADDDAP